MQQECTRNIATGWGGCVRESEPHMQVAIKDGNGFLLLAPKGWCAWELAVSLRSDFSTRILVLYNSWHYS